MKNLAVIAVFIAASFVGFKTPPSQAATCTVHLFIHGQEYRGVVTRSVRTSCPFARRVAAKSLRFLIDHGGAGDGDFYIRVYSPVTYKTYRMQCFAHGILYDWPGMTVTCRGGIGALVRYVAHNS